MLPTRPISCAGVVKELVLKTVDDTVGPLIVCVKFVEYLLRSVLKLEQDVILVRDNYDVAHEPLPDDIRARLREVYEITSIDSIEELSAVWVDVQLRFPDQVRRVLSGAEYGMFAAGYLRAAFGLDPSEPELTIVAHDKRWMKKKFADAGIPCARFISNYRTGVPLENDFFPVVAKPVAGTGSFNPKVLHSKEELDAYVMSEQLHPALVARQWAVEEKVDGDEYHVDAWLRAELGLEIAGIPGPGAEFTCAGFLSITPDRSGVVSNVPTAEEYRAFEGVTYVRITTAVGATYRHDNPSNWCVLLSMQARDQADFVAKCDELYSALPVLL